MKIHAVVVLAALFLLTTLVTESGGISPNLPVEKRELEGKVWNAL